MLIAYIRHTPDTPAGPSYDAQYDQIVASVGTPDRIVEETRPLTKRLQGLEELLEQIGRGDVLVVASLDRLARSVPYCRKTVDILQRVNAHLVSLEEGVDTREPDGGKVIATIAALDEMSKRATTEKSILEQRRCSARIGPPAKITDSDLERARQQIVANPDQPLREISTNVGISRSSLYRLFGGAEGIDQIRAQAG